MPNTNELNLTPRQLQTLKLIADYQSSRCYSITIQELAGRLGVSRTTAFEHVSGLKEKELLTASRGRARSLKITEQGQKLLDGKKSGCEETNNGGFPLLGRVAAGVPIEAIENRSDFSLINQFGSSSDIFALEVSGESMIDENIFDGDVVVCKKAASARDGELVIAVVEDNDATLKRFYKEKDRVRLEPANSEYQPIYTNSCRIEAVVVGLVRKL